MTTPKKAAGRSLADFPEHERTKAEKMLLEACRLGIVAPISDERPEAQTADNTVRAEFLRFLALGGDEQAPVHERGVRLMGAWIEGGLDMRGCKIPFSLAIVNCYFKDIPVFQDTNIAGVLNLSGCHLPGLNGDRLVCDRGLCLRDKFIATGEVSLLAAQISGDLDCSNAEFENKNGDALSADRAVVKGNIFLSDGFAATGKVRFLGAQIGGDLDCCGSTFTGKITDDKYGEALSVDGAVVKGNIILNEEFAAIGKVRLTGVQIGGDLNCSGATFDGKGGAALVAERMTVEGVFFFRRLKSAVNKVFLASSHVGRLADEAKSWGEELILDGFTYGSITGGAPTEAVIRLAWLDKQRKSHAGLEGDGKEFKPQPWRQLIKVLREMGHAEDARQVAIAFEHRLREANLIGQTPKNWGVFRSWIYRNVSRAGHWLFGVFTGYGYRPLRLLGWMVGVWLLCAGIYWHAALEGVFAPSSPPVFQNPDYAICKPDYTVCKQDYVAPAPRCQAASAISPTVRGVGNWYRCDKLPQAYPRLSPLMYSLDVLLPPIDLQQNKNWIPISPTPDEDSWYEHVQWLNVLKHFTRLVLWFEILFGWVSTLLLVAVVSGLTKRRED